MKRRLDSSESFTWLVNLFVDLMEVEDFFLALRIEQIFSPSLGVFPNSFQVMNDIKWPLGPSTSYLKRP